jgi:hypothetical protein
MRFVTDRSRAGGDVASLTVIEVMIGNRVNQGMARMILEVCWVENRVKLTDDTSSTIR